MDSRLSTTHLKRTSYCDSYPFSSTSPNVTVLCLLLSFLVFSPILSTCIRAEEETQTQSTTINNNDDKGGDCGDSCSDSSQCTGSPECSYCDPIHFLCSQGLPCGATCRPLFFSFGFCPFPLLLLILLPTRFGVDGLRSRRRLHRLSITSV
jgi:hypothetical protein